MVRDTFVWEDRSPRQEPARNGALWAYLSERLISSLRKTPLKNPIRHAATRATSNARSWSRLWEWHRRDAFGAARGAEWGLVEAFLDAVDPGFKAAFVARFPVNPPGGGIGKTSCVFRRDQSVLPRLTDLPYRRSSFMDLGLGLVGRC